MITRILHNGFGLSLLNQYIKNEHIYLCYLSNNLPLDNQYTAYSELQPIANLIVGIKATDIQLAYRSTVDDFNIVHEFLIDGVTETIYLKKFDFNTLGDDILASIDSFEFFFVINKKVVWEDLPESVIVGLAAYKTLALLELPSKSSSLITDTLPTDGLIISITQDDSGNDFYVDTTGFYVDLIEYIFRVDKL